MADRETLTLLTPIQKLRVAAAVLLHGVDQDKVAVIPGVDPGQVAEAVRAVRDAVDWPV